MPPSTIRIFGREPAVLLNLVEATLMLSVAIFGTYLGLDGGFTVAALAVASAGIGLWTAAATQDKLLGAATGAAKAIIGLALYFGAGLSVELQATILTFVAAAVGFWQRTQTSPVADPVDPSPEQVTASPVSIADDGPNATT